MNYRNKTNFNFPTSIRFGAGVIDELGAYLRQEGKKAPLVVTDPGLAKLPVFQRVLDILAKSDLQPTAFHDIAKNPVKSNVASGVKAYNHARSDSIVGIGGGASMDVARAIVLWVNHADHDLFDFDDTKGGDRFVVNDIPFFVTVPTTSGTGSEVGRSTVIADDVTHEKKILFSPKLLARKVFADPELTLGLPPFVTAATGMDALTHNLEAYIAQGFSPLCDGVAVEGLRLIFASLKQATQQGDYDARAQMQVGSLMGATAFQKGLGIVHSLAHPLSTVYDMHHGLANAIMLPFGMEFNAKVSEERFQRVIDYCDLKITPADFPRYLKDFSASLGLPTTLKGQITPWTSEHHKKLSQLAFNDPCHPSNPRAVTEKDFYEIYEKAVG